MVVNRLERMVRQVRRWRPLGSDDRLRLRSSLPDDDLSRIRREIDDCLAARGGEVAARRRARSIGAAFSELDSTGRRRLFELLATDYDHDDDAVDLAVAELGAAVTPEERAVAVQTLRQATQPRFEALLRRFIAFEGGLSFVVDLREDLLDYRNQSARLQRLDTQVRLMLERWVDVGLLQLEELTWNSPASLLEKLIEYEAVHTITSWDDLRGRLGQGRRCYAFMHPAMPGDPLIFVEVALERGTPAALGPLLDHDATRIDATEADTAVFYSISNCHRGLAGVSLGDFLIKRVVQRLSAELPNVKNFVTLSPIPGFRSWLETTQDRPVAGRAPEPIDDQRDELLKLAAHYLVDEKRRTHAADPVAHFHLSNGARVERLNWMANPEGAGWDRSLGLMVNYRYQLKAIEENHDRYVRDGTVAVSDEIKKLLDG